MQDMQTPHRKATARIQTDNLTMSQQWQIAHSCPTHSYYYLQ